jgi:hypothetical protein
VRGRILVVLAVSFSGVGTPSAVLAQAVDQPLPPSTAPSSAPLLPRAPPPAPASNQSVMLDGWIGIGATTVVDGNAAAIAALGVTGLYHRNWLELGAGLTWQPPLAGLGTSDVVATLLAGVKVDPAPRLRLELLAEGGIDHVSLGGGASETVDSGGGATLPYVGGRVGVSFPLGDARRLIIGWWVGGGAAIGPVVVNSVITNCNSNMVCTTAPQTDTIGGVTWSTALRVVWEVGPL